MVYQENEEVYLTLPRKVLQGLCQKHGLPVNHSKIELAKMLVVYFTLQKKRAATKEQRGHRRGSSSKQVVSSLRLKRENSACGNKENGKVSEGTYRKTNDDFKERIFAIKENAGENLKHSYRTGLALDATAAGDVSVHTLPLTDGKKEQSNENDLASFHIVPEEVHGSFEFFVRSEEGIKLYIDLKNEPLEWINGFKDEVSIFEKTHKDGNWTICSEIRDKDFTDKSLKCFGENLDSSSDSRSHAVTSACFPVEKEHLDEQNQVALSSSMTCSHLQNCTASGCLSCSVDVEAPIHNRICISPPLLKSHSSVARGSSSEIPSNVDMDDSAKVTDNLIVKDDNISSHNAELASLDDSFNSATEKTVFSLLGENEDRSKSYESDRVENCTGACQMSTRNFLLLSQSDGGQSIDHSYEEHTSSSLGNIATRKQNLLKIGEQNRRSHLKDKSCLRTQHSRSDKKLTKSCYQEMLQSKRRHADIEENIELISDFSKTKALASVSTSDHSHPRRSIRLISK